MQNINTIEIQHAINNLNIPLARDLLRTHLQDGTHNAEVYFLAAQVAVDNRQRIEFLRRAVEIDPFHAGAVKMLTELGAFNGGPNIAESAQFHANAIISDVPLAEPGQRFLAWFIDLAILSVMLFALIIFASYTFSFLDNVVSREISESLMSYIAITLIIFGFLFLITYLFVIPVFIWKGQTVGKHQMKIKIQRVDKSKFRLSHAFLRFVVGLPLSTIFLGIGLLWALWDPNRQTWHDKLVNTIVVKTGK